VARIGPRRPLAAQVLPQALGLAVVTPMATRQAPRANRRHFRQLPIDWRPQGPQREYGAGGGESDTTPGGNGLGLNDCEGC
jgi:hypothetical protein